MVAVHRDTLKECRICVEGELKKAEVGKARIQAAAARVADALVRRAAKRVRSAETAGDQVIDGAGVQTHLAADAQAAPISSAAPTESVTSSFTAAALEMRGSEQLFQHKGETPER